MYEKTTVSINFLIFASCSFNSANVCPPGGRLCIPTEQEASTCNAERRGRKVGGAEEERKTERQGGVEVGGC